MATLRRLVLLKLQILPSRAARSLVNFETLFDTSIVAGICDGGVGIVLFAGTPSPCRTSIERERNKRSMRHQLLCPGSDGGVKVPTLVAVEVLVGLSERSGLLPFTCFIPFALN